MVLFSRLTFAPTFILHPANEPYPTSEEMSWVAIPMILERWGAAMSKEAVKKALSGILRDYSDKDISNAIGCSLHTAYNIRNGLTEPESFRLIRLMEKYDAVHEAIIYMANRAPATLTEDQTLLIQQAVSLLGSAFPAHQKQDSSCRQFSYQPTNGANQQKLLIPRLAISQQ